MSESRVGGDTEAASQPGGPPDVSVILANYNTAHLFDRVFEALKAGQRA
jgi:hypothetical protein